MARFEFHEAEYAAMVATYGRQARHHFADPIERDARLLAPRDTGELQTHIGQHDEGDETLIGAEVEHAAPQEEGASPHHIPNGFGRDEGVNHPGNDATNYLKRALYKRRSV